jgi:methenyltetrahydromethanopterin cyclohydrolase
MAISVNDRAWRRLQSMLADAEALRLEVTKGPAGETLINAGAPGGIAAGVAMAELCLASLGTVTLITDPTLPHWPATITIASSQPVLACLASQYAGWSLSLDSYFSLGSGPARALSRREPLFAELGYADRASHAVLVLESAKPPPPPLLAQIAEQCGVKGEALAIVYAPTQSLAGSTQVVARVLEVAMHKAHTLHFPLDRITDGIAAAPLPPPHPDFVTAMGRTNDAIIFGGRVHLFVHGPDADAEALATQLPASGSRDYGKPFAEIFRAAKGDFYAIDPMLFSPAQALITAIDSGRTFRGGALAPGLLDQSFGA